MKINNVQNLNNKIECDKIVANHLINKGYSPISKDRNVYYFAKSDNILEECNSLPFMIKLLGRVGVE